MDEQTLQLIEFTLNHNTDLTHMSRRVRLIAVLTECSQKQRDDLSKAVTTVCWHFLSLGVPGKVKVAFVNEAGQQFLQVSVQDEGLSETHRKDQTAKSQKSERAMVHRLRHVVSHFDLEGQIGTGALARIRQMLPQEFNVPSRTEATLWRRMIQQQSLEDAILVACQYARQVESESHTMRNRHSLRDEIGHGSEDSESLFSLIASETDNFVVVMDADGNITWVNNAFVRMTGYSSEEINRRRLDELLGGPSSNKQVMRDFRDALRHGHRFNDELLLYRRDGRAYWTHFTLTPVRRGNRNVSRWIAIGTDVTQQRQVVDALAASKQAAETASRVKSEFLANISHEIRTPLNAIIGMTELSLGTQLSREQRGYLSSVKLSAESLLELVNDVLDLSKIEAGKLNIDCVEFNLADLVRDTVRGLAVRARSKGIELACHLPPDLSQWLKGDPIRLRQILVNLIGNAIKFTNVGKVMVEVEPRWQNSDSVSLHFCVRDTGIGIPRGQLERIFEAFEQADTSTTREYGGTGLGLTITSELLHMMGGGIWVESQPDEGSCFHISLTFPIAKNRPRTRKADVSQREGCGGLVADGNSGSRPRRELRVLVADDHEANRQLATSVLEKRGHKCVEAMDGRQTVEQHARADPPFDIILMDIQMPELDGFLTTARIREAERTSGRHIPIIALTAHAMKGDREQCLAGGMDAYLSKPIRPSELVSLVESISSESGEQPVQRTDPPATPDVDVSCALERLDGDVDLLRTQMEYFLKDGPALVAEIRSGIVATNAERIQRAAHRLKGLFAGYGRQESSQFAARLEQEASQGKVAGAAELYHEIEEDVQLLLEEIRAYL